MVAKAACYRWSFTERFTSLSVNICGNNMFPSVRPSSVKVQVVSNGTGEGMDGYLFYI